VQLIKDRFVPWAPGWGKSGYKSDEAFLGTAWADGGFQKSRFAGTDWHIMTASGKPVPGGLKSPQQRGLEGVLEDFKKLPASERQPVLGDRGPFTPGPETFTAEPPRGGLVLNVYQRPLKREGKGRFVPQREQLDLSEFAGPTGRYADMTYPEPQRDALWLTEAEWKSLVPRNPKKGDTVSVPAAIRLRIFLCYLYNQFSQYGGRWFPGADRSGDLRLSVEDVSPTALRLHLQGSVLLALELEKEAAIKNGIANDLKHQALPDKLRWAYDAGLYGVLDYDTAKKSFTRFDFVALGDYRGSWQRYYKERPVPLGVVFELDRRDLPRERRNRMPFALFASRYYGSRPLDYWALDKYYPKGSNR
jgi:hypothetical protein